MQISIHQSLIRKQLFLGANKLAVYALVIICAIPLIPLGGLLRIYTLQGFISFFACVLTWVLGLMLLRLLARYDASFFTVAFRYLKYQKYYPAITSSKFKAKNPNKTNWRN
jgi:type IV secretory pathway TrbD component